MQLRQRHPLPGHAVDGNAAVKHALYGAVGGRVGRCAVVHHTYSRPGEIKPFSKATVTKIYPESGQVTMQLTKRGTSKMWEITVGAGCIEERIETPSKSQASNNASRDGKLEMLTFELVA